MEPCYCILGWPDECDKGEKCTATDQVKEVEPLGIMPDQQRTPKADKLVGDVKSTGRKRAVLVKPITEGMACEWLGLRNAGGGIFPIIGCVNGTANAVHHGPNKNTLDNRESNLHRICNTCHNRWHSRNDHTYPEENIGENWYPLETFAPHDTETKATVKEQLLFEAEWIRK